MGRCVVKWNPVRKIIHRAAEDAGCYGDKSAAQKMGMLPDTFGKKMRGEISWSGAEIGRAVRVFKINQDEAMKILEYLGKR